jgi:hypothetical protein
VASQLAACWLEGSNLAFRSHRQSKFDCGSKRGVASVIGYFEAVKVSSGGADSWTTDTHRDGTLSRYKTGRGDLPLRTKEAQSKCAF